MTDIHSCSYYCDRPGCIKAQRDELRDRLGSMTDRELMQQALDALQTSVPTHDGFLSHCKAMNHLRIRLAQPEQEPVALVIDGVLVKSELPEKYTGHLYIAPPQRKPLTDEEIERACVPLGAAMLSFTEVARAIEAAHGIKE